MPSGSPRRQISGAISEAEYLSGLRAEGLVDVEVRARLIYDADQLQGIANSESELACGCGIGKHELMSLARGLAGKIWSVEGAARDSCVRADAPCVGTPDPGAIHPKVALPCSPRDYPSCPFRNSRSSIGIIAADTHDRWR